MITGSKQGKLWYLDLQQDGQQHNNSSSSSSSTEEVVEQNIAAQVVRHSTIAETITYAHNCMSATPYQTFYTAIQRSYIRPPGINIKNLARNVPVSVATAKGHLKMQRKNQRSTKGSEEEQQQMFNFPSKLKTITPKNVMFHVRVVEGLSADLTGRFSVAKFSSQYHMVFYCAELNYIHVEVLTGRTAGEICKAYSNTLELLSNKGYVIAFVHMDNETSGQVEKFLKNRPNPITIQYAPPGNHRSLAAERAIQTWKAHFISTLCCTDDDFLANDADKLVAHAELTLNLLRGSALNPSISAWHQLHGHIFDWDATPLAPPGTKVIIHDRSDSRGSWQVHGSEGFYIGPAMDHYRCWRVLVSKSGAERVSDTIEWFPKKTVMPGASLKELFTANIEELILLIRKIANSGTNVSSSQQPISAVTDTLSTALRKYGEMFHSWSSEDKSTTADSTQQQSAVTVSEDSSASQRVPEESDPTTITTQRVADTQQHQPAAIVSDTHTQQQQSLTTAIAPTSSIATQRVPFSNPNIKSQRVASTNPMSQAKQQQPTRQSTRERRAPKFADETKQASTNAVIASTVPSLNSSINSTSTSSVLQVQMSALQEDPESTHFMAKLARNTRKFNKRHKKASESAAAMVESSSRINQHDSVYSQAVQSEYYAATAVDIDETGKKLTYRNAMNGHDREEWRAANAREIRKLAIETKTIRFIARSEVPKDRKVVYYNPQIKTKTVDGVLTYRVRGTIGGDQVDYNGQKASNAAEMTTIKILYNSVVSEMKAKFMKIDIKDFYLGTTLPRLEYMRISEHQLDDELANELGILHLKYNGYYYCEVSKGIYGLPHAGKLANEKLVKVLATAGYREAKNTPCLFTHDTNDVVFTLVVDDFGVKYTNRADVEEFIAVLEQTYELHIDWEGRSYVGTTLEWNYTANPRSVTLSMPNYIEKALDRFLPDPASRVGANTPMLYTPPVYGQAIQFDKEEDQSPKLPPDRIKRIQEIVGVFKYYARALDCTLETATNIIGSRQADATEAVEDMCNRILQYAAKFPNAKVIIRASKMQLIVHADASYLCETGSRSRAGGHIFLGDSEHPEIINGAVLTISQIIESIVASACESEYASLFKVAQAAEVLRNTLCDMGYQQQATKLLCDNTCAIGIANSTAKQKRSKAINMRFHWIRDRVKDGHFYIEWIAGGENIADFFTKNLPLAIYKKFKNRLVISEEVELKI
jgi:hypothetical protein